MPIITTYICDRCKLTLEAGLEKFDLTIYVQEYNQPLSVSNIRKGILCSECARTLNLLPYGTAKEPVKIEQLISELVETVVDDKLTARG